MATTNIIHQAKVTYADGATSRFVSQDGLFYYEHQLPERNGRTMPLRFGKDWLRQKAAEWDGIASIEFTETEA